MFFYKFEGRLKENTISEICEHRPALIRSISYYTNDFNVSDDFYIFVSALDKDSVSIALITRNNTPPYDHLKDYLKNLPIEAEDFIIDEITIDTISDMIHAASSNKMISKQQKIANKFDIEKVSRGINFGENFCEEISSKEALLSSVEKYAMAETLTPEIERIYAGAKNIHASGHPVHYIVECDDPDTRREVYKSVLDALYTNNRLESKRYAFLNFSPSSSYSPIAYNALYKLCSGGAIVVRYMKNTPDDEYEYEDEDCSIGEYKMIENICQMAKLYRHSVLTVICLPRGCEKLKSSFYENLGTMSFIEIKEDFIKNEKATELLASFAKENHVRADKKLYERIQSDEPYLVSDLRIIFDEWYNEKLKNSIYPQYKDVAVAKRNVSNAKPVGSAFKELDEMIGLGEAKQVIKKAINYYKMQGIYEEKGVKRDNPAMHMIFSGNPGTAKTTVARLFARIMRENKLLSKGHLVEVGRADLVGKFVGWTAKIVKSKFKEALGGVLFIDEAYSLVDERGGLYGDEAINTIVQEMENHRSELVVIFAGYPDKMEQFLAQNPGLRSRIAFHVPFADYNSEELCKIAEMMSKKNGMKIDEDAYIKLEKLFDSAKEQTDFGNGRYVRNIFEQAKMNQASRLLQRENIDDFTTDEIITITSDDIIAPPSVTKFEKKRIGF